MAKFESSSKHRAAGDQYSDAIDASAQGRELALTGQHPLDQAKARKVHHQLLEWFYLEREKQSANRMEMAMDHDFYDGMQWDEQDAQALRDRGQMPLVFNEVAPMVDWLIGTERRARVDWKVLPRTEDDVKSADIKTKTLKYVSDINRSPFARSRSFADAAKGGVGWVDDGARDDPTQDVLYSKYEDWRRVLWDSANSYEYDLTDSRYLFRWRWVDEDVALMMFPDRRAQILAAVGDAAQYHDSGWEEDEWQRPAEENIRRSGHLYASGGGTTVDAKRRQIRLIECQYRMPVMTKVIVAGPFKGTPLHPDDSALHQALGQVGGSVVDKMMMRMHVAVFTESDMLAMGTSIYRHNKFSLTPIWFYRRNRDRLPYGAIRRVRDVQQDMNKRASKALFLLNTNQIVADEGAVDDWDELRDEVDRPDGLIVKKPGKEVVIRRDTDAATGQIQMMTLDAQSIQKSGGVNDDNLGRKTNAVSGEAIKARQNQGSVATTEPFDNLRLAVQVQGEKQLSLIEQFYTEEKVMRLTGAKGAIDWVYVNKPELQADGSVRFINDITASMADFIVSEQDYAGTLRQVMFDSLNQMAAKLPPEVSLRMLTIAMEFSDMPNKDEIAEQFRKLTGDRDPTKEMTPEEMEQAQTQLQQQAEAMQTQRESAMLALEEQRAKVREINAKASNMEAEAQNSGAGGLPPEVQRSIQQIQEQAANQIDDLSQKLVKAQSDSAMKTMAINKEADTKLELGRIQAASDERVAEIGAASDKKIKALEDRIADLMRSVNEVTTIATDATKRTEKLEKTPPPTPAPAPVAAPAAPTAAPMELHVHLDNKTGAVTKKLLVERDKDGALIGGSVEITPKAEPKSEPNA